MPVVIMGSQMTGRWAVNMDQPATGVESWGKCTPHAALLRRFASVDLPCIGLRHESQLSWSVPMLLPSY